MQSKTWEGRAQTPPTSHLISYHFGREGDEKVDQIPRNKTPNDSFLIIINFYLFFLLLFLNRNFISLDFISKR